MNIDTWLEQPKTIEKSKKTYAHFDHRTDMNKAAEYIKNPDNVAKHGFYPFIHYTMRMTKFNKENGKKLKKREIYYAAHLDRCIYQYYAYMLNEYYNCRIKQEGIDHVPVAYRTDLKDSNIQSAHKAFDFIRKNEKCYVMIGDFTNFFDNLDHKYLKKQWCSLIEKETLPKDHYAVYKNITKYSSWELDDLLELNGLKKSNSGRKELNKKKVVLEKKEFDRYRGHISKNRLSYGIPQGAPISAVLANIYMLEADKLIFEKVSQYHGFYMRYSDDFIIVLPEDACDDKQVFQEIIEIIKGVPNLKLESQKTQFFYVNLPNVSNIGTRYAKEADVSQSRINFLGFSFDGNKINIRPKTISKYYYRMNRKAKAIAKNEGQTGADHLYMLYSERGAKVKKGNFFTYINKAEAVFGDSEMIRADLKNHMPKIRKVLKKMKNMDLTR